MIPETTETPQKADCPSAPCSALEVLAKVLEMPAEELRGKAQGIREERKKIALLEKLKIIREGNTAILPTGEIVARGTAGAMDYTTMQSAACPDSSRTG